MFLSKEEIDTFNEVYISSCIKVVKSIISGKILFQDLKINTLGDRLLKKYILM